MYDLSGLRGNEPGAGAEDRARLGAEGAAQSPAYAHHRGHPVPALWGVGFHDRPLRPAGLLALFAALRRLSGVAGRMLPGRFPFSPDLLLTPRPLPFP